MIKKFRKKPVVIEAIQFTGKWNNYDEISDFIGEPKLGYTEDMEDLPNTLSINTLEGYVRADVGDWIIKGVKGEVYPCKPGIFDMVYEDCND